MYTYDIRSVVGVYTPVGVATEWLWSVHSKLECTLRQGKGRNTQQFIPTHEFPITIVPILSLYLKTEAH